MATFVVTHGAWSAGWAWKKIRERLSARGHTVFTPTHTGLGERHHLAGPDIDLDLHIQDIVNVLEFEDLNDVILVGHSYGGMVATGVADRVAERIKTIVYVDAHVPRDGDSVFSLNPDRRENMKDLIDSGGWEMPPSQSPDDTSEEDLAWTKAHRKPQPVKTFDQPIKLQNGEPKMPRTYVYCKRIRPGDVFRKYLERAKEEGWGIYEIDSSHSPNVTQPDLLTDVLDEIAGKLG